MKTSIDGELVPHDTAVTCAAIVKWLFSVYTFRLQLNFLCVQVVEKLGVVTARGGAYTDDEREVDSVVRQLANVYG